MWKWLTGKKDKAADTSIVDEVLDSEPLDIDSISQLFCNHFIEQYDFDYSSFSIEDLDTLTSASLAIKTLINLDYISVTDNMTSIGLMGKLSNLGLLQGLGNKHKIITFKFSRNYGVLYENRHMFGFLLDDKYLYFPKKINNSELFDHYKFDGYLDYVKSDANYYNFYDYYLYDFTENNLFYMIDIPIYSAINRLELIRKDKEYFKNSRTYVLQCKMIIKEQYISCKSTMSLSFKNKIRRELQFNIFGLGDFKKAIYQLLFPFNLTSDELEELGIDELDITQIDNYFENEFQVKKMMEI